MVKMDAEYDTVAAKCESLADLRDTLSKCLSHLIV